MSRRADPPSTVRELLTLTNGKLAIADLVELIARLERSSQRYFLLVSAAFVLMIAAAGVGGSVSIGVVWILALIGCIVGLAAWIPALLLGGQAQGDAGVARRALAALRAEQDSVRRAHALATSGRTYALFLRGFSAEARGLSATDRDATNESLVVHGSMLASAYGQEPWFSGEDFLPRDSSWSLEVGIVRALADRIPTALLGNLHLGANQRAELPSNLIELTIVNEWWSAFEELARAAAVTVAFVDDQSSQLWRELAFLRANDLRQIVVARRGLDLGATIEYDGYADETVGELRRFLTRDDVCL